MFSVRGYMFASKTPYSHSGIVDMIHPVTAVPVCAHRAELTHSPAARDVLETSPMERIIAQKRVLYLRRCKGNKVS